MKYLILLLALTASAFGQQLKSPGVNGENIVNPAFRNAVLPSNSTPDRYLKSDGAGGVTWATVVSNPTNGTNGQILTSNGSSGFGTPVTLGTAATADMEDLPVSTATQTALNGKLATTADLQAIQDSVNSQPYSHARWSAWNGSSARPLRLARIGDSLSVFGAGLTPGPQMGNAGYIGLGFYSPSVGVTSHSAGVNPRMDYWINGNAQTFAVGASAQYTRGGSAVGDLRGNKACIAYIKKADGGSFDLEYQVNGTGAWTVLATINTFNATTVGAYGEYSLPESNSPFFRLRVNNVVTNPIVVVFTGIYNSNGGGVIFCPIGSEGGLDMTAIMSSTPSAVFTPIWTGLAPDAVLSLWADDSSNWESGGAFRSFYAMAKSAFSATDWIQISRNPSNETAEADPVAAGKLLATNQATAQRAWALEERQTFINGLEIFGGDYTVANARGLTSDDVHPSTAGCRVRNNAMWHKLPLGQLFLGGGWASFADIPDLNGSAISGNLTNQPFEFSKIFALRGAAASFRLFDQSNLMDNSLRWDIAANNKILNFTNGAQSFFQVRATTDGSAGIYPGFNTMFFGSAALRTRPFFGDTNISGSVVLVPDSQTATTAAVSIVTPTTALTTTAPAQAITLANGTHGQTKIITHVATSGGGTAVLTPATKTGYTTITFTAVTDTVTLQYYTTIGWVIVAIRGSVAA